MNGFSRGKTCLSLFSDRPPTTYRQWHELQLPPLQLEQPEEEAEDEYFPLLLKLQEERTRSTFLPLQSGQQTVGLLPKTRHSKSLSHFLQ